jgi:hypothetical protein
MGAWSDSFSIRSRVQTDTIGYLSSHLVSINTRSLITTIN